MDRFLLLQGSRPFFPSPLLYYFSLVRDSLAIAAAIETPRFFTLTSSHHTCLLSIPPSTLVWKETLFIGSACAVFTSPPIRQSGGVALDALARPLLPRATLRKVCENATRQPHLRFRETTTDVKFEQFRDRKEHTCSCCVVVALLAADLRPSLSTPPQQHRAETPLCRSAK